MYTDIRGIDMYVHYNNNPCGINNGDCVIRAISIVTGYSWKKVYAGLCIQGYKDCGFGNFNSVWADYLAYIGYKRYSIIGDITVAEFAELHPNGSYILGTGTHAVAVVNGDWVDSWDSGGEKPIYYFVKE